MGSCSTKIRIAQIVVMLFSLTACAKTDDATTSPVSEKFEELTYQYQNNEWGMSLSVPRKFSSTLDEEGMFFGYGPAYGDFSIQIYQPNIAPSCSSTAIGISDPITLNEANTESIWGRMDYREVYWTMDFPIEFTDICGQQTGEAIYAFCSEKGPNPDNKRVAICISQQTDDSKMAEEIFKTFKWIK